MISWVVDPLSTKYESVLEHVPSQRLKLGAMFHQFKKAEKYCITECFEMRDTDFG